MYRQTQKKANACIDIHAHIHKHTVTQSDRPLDRQTHTRTDQGIQKHGQTHRGTDTKTCKTDRGRTDRHRERHKVRQIDKTSKLLDRHKERQAGEWTEGLGRAFIG